MTSFPFVALIVMASVQAPSSTPAPPEDTITARVPPSDEASAATGIGTQPFQKLFTQPKNAATQEERARRLLDAQKQFADRNAPKIVCGMIVIPADPGIDPKMVHRSGDSSTTFHIRRIPPPACAE